MGEDTLSELPLTKSQFEADKQRASETFDVIKSDPHSLLLDLDTPEAVAQFERLLPKLRENWDVDTVERWPSRNGNTHVHIKLASPIWRASDRLCLQAALGSDGLKELLSLKRWYNGVEEPSLLWKPRPVEFEL